MYAFGVSLFHIPSNSLQNSALFDLNMGTFTLCVKDLSFVKWEGWLMEPKCSVREGDGMAHRRSSSEDKDDVRHLNSDFLIQIRYRLLLFLFSSKNLNISIKRGNNS